MRIYSIYKYLFLMMLSLAFALPVGAQTESAPQPAPQLDFRNGTVFEVNPYTGAMGGSGLFGMRLGMNYGVIKLELGLAQIIGESADMYPVTANVAFNLSTKGKWLPYGTVGGGLLMTVPTESIGANTVSSMAVNVGGGTRLFIARNLGISFEARQYLTQLRNEIAAENELLLFREFNVGFTFLFR